MLIPVALLFQVATLTPIMTSDVMVSTRPGAPTPNVRIPGFVVTSRGSLLAFAEGRIGNGDPGDDHPIAMLMSRSTDSGRTWSAPVVILRDSSFDFANPTPLLDRTTGTVWLAFDRFPDRCGSNRDCTTPGNDPTDRATIQTSWVMPSRDDGRTWGAPQLLPKPLRTADGIWWRSAAVGPGSGIQLDAQRDPKRNGRLVIPGRRIGSPDSLGRGTGGEPFTFHSDDHGRTWQLGGVTSGAGANEPEVAELGDGRLLMEARQNSGPHRWRWWSEDGGATWGPPIAGDIPITPVDASLIRLRDNRLAFTGPVGPARTTLGVWLSEDGLRFTLIGVAAPGHAGYSVAQQLPDGTLGIVYEATGDTLIRFVRLALPAPGARHPR